MAVSEAAPARRRPSANPGWALGTAMFAPSVLFILALIGVPFCLAVFYAFSDARIGSTGLHFVG